MAQLLPVQRRPAVLLGLLLVFALSPTLTGSELRKTPIVRAVESARASVVNIHGQKTLPRVASGLASGEAERRVNGMGTGIVIDERGYILTNYHVVEGVERINVTLDTQKTYIATLVAHDPPTDLAVIQLEVPFEMPVIRTGTSSDLMLGEPVIAIGNAYGYEHTVTHGIISHLHRDVEVSETQRYRDLIQTSAAINPGNSGGPLLNIDGEMIGLNVAVRAGAQNIAFAIPVDAAMRIAARLMSVRRIEGKWHGLLTNTAGSDGRPAVVEEVEPGSPAEEGGLQVGDRIERIGDVATSRALDIERALLGREDGDKIEIAVIRGGKPMQLALTVSGDSRQAAESRWESETDRRTWEFFGLRLQPVTDERFASRNSRYNGGMRVTHVRSGGPAARQGIQSGDVLVGMHRWETASTQDMRYIVSLPNLDEIAPIKFYILRGDETLFGHLQVARRATRRR